MTLAEAVRTLPVGTRLARRRGFGYSSEVEVVWVPIYPWHDRETPMAYVVGVDGMHSIGNEDDWEVVG